MISTIRKYLLIYGDSPTCPNLVKFGPQTADNGWPVFAHPLNYRIGRHCQPDSMDVDSNKLWHVLCNGTSLQSRTRWALPCIKF